MTRTEKPGFQYVDKPEIRLSGIRKAVIFGDPGCTRFSGDSKKVLERILSQEADLFMVIGDLAFLDSQEEMREMIGFAGSRVKVPVFAQRGNHELSLYAEYLGRSSYALVLERHVFFFLDNAAGRFQDADLELLEKSFEKNTDKGFIILMHVPPPGEGLRKTLRPEDWGKLKAVLDAHRERVLHLYCGHIHGFYEYQADGYPVTVTAGGGAAMIHPLPASARKLHHSIEICLNSDGTMKAKMVPAGPLPQGETPSGGTRHL